MTAGVEAIRRADDEARRLRRTPADVNLQELRNGSRWTLLQSLAWIATESDDFVRLVGNWTPPGNALPNPNASQGVRLQMNQILRNLLPPALSLPAAQMNLLRLINKGEVVLFVEHGEWVASIGQFTTLSYEADYTGLSPAPDDRYWGYVVVDAQSLKHAWAVSRSDALPTNAAFNKQAETAISLVQHLEKADVEGWYQKRVEEADAAGIRWSRQEDFDAGKAIGIGSNRVRILRRQYANHWSHGGKPTSRERAAKAEFIKQGR